MRNAELNRQAKKILELAARTSSAVGSDDELRAHWARYLAVLTAGLLENSLRLLYSEFVTKASSGPVARYATGHLERIRNPKPGKFLEVAGRFKDIWRTDLEKFLETDGRSEAIEAIMNARHQIAHGKDSGITLAQLTNYFNKIVEVIEFIEKQIKS
ncbi:MAG TPA: HEPN domain-containing protein [Candidatus Saccharimonadales bacterium]|nr:HEPN domain-containing protein [Candidatus Saccharimonadales bacterium]